MAAKDKPTMPPYASYKSFSRFINSLRSNGMPSHINRSIIPGSNSGKAAMSSTLRSMNLIDEEEAPTKAMKQLVDPEVDYSKKLKEILLETYPFLTDGSINVANTTTEKVAEKFKAAGARGSTISKGMSFFLSASKDAGIEISPHVKAPAPPRQGTGKSKERSQPQRENPETDEGDLDFDAEGMICITIPLHGMQDGRVYFQEEMNSSQWQYALTMTKFILEHYRHDEPAEKAKPEGGDGLPDVI